MITRNDLRTLGACDDACDAFATAFPVGAPDWLAIADHPACRPAWRGWIAANVPDVPLFDRERLAGSSDDPARSRGWIAVSAPDVPLSHRERLAGSSDNPARSRGWIAAATPGVPLSDRERLAGSSDDPAYWRGAIAACS